MRFGQIFVFCFLSFAFAGVSCGQYLPDKQLKLCTKKPVNKGKYSVLSLGLGVELQIDLEIKPKYRTNENYIAIAKELLEKYCRVERLRVTYFASKRQWKIIDPKDFESTPLAIFYFDKENPEKKEIHLYKVLNGKVETEVLPVNR